MTFTLRPSAILVGWPKDDSAWGMHLGVRVIWVVGITPRKRKLSFRTPQVPG
ncbi:MAG TPA: hypothetical protein VJX70_05595 [Candidatus Acidoferrum sp.]|nr:hypothetical protein [Candidatus Acidoferrum sp.]